MSHDYTQLNAGCDGDFLDESGITYPTDPTLRKRSRVVISGDVDKDELAGVVNVQPSSNDYGLVTRPIPFATPHPGIPIINYYAVDSVPDNVETVIGIYTVPVGYKFYLANALASGDINARYKLYLNDVLTLQGRTTAAYLNIEMGLGTTVRPSITTGQQVKLSLIHCLVGQLPNFNGTIVGYIV